MNVHLTLKPIRTISIQMLHQILQVCDSLQTPIVFKALYLFTFFSFLRLSNILPHAVKQFDVTRHLTRGDLIFAPGFCMIIIKWSKTLQDRQSFTTVTIPDLDRSPLCPIKALFAVVPASKNAPLFCLSKNANVTPLTDSVARKHLKQVSTVLQIDPPLTFHLFRKSATTLFIMVSPCKILCIKELGPPMLFGGISSLPTLRLLVLFKAIYLFFSFTLGFGRHFYTFWPVNRLSSSLGYILLLIFI